MQTQGQRPHPASCRLGRPQPLEPSPPATCPPPPAAQVLQQEVRRHRAMMPEESCLRDLVLTEPLGRGGSVFRGRWQKSVAAIKLMYARADERQVRGGRARSGLRLPLPLASARLTFPVERPMRREVPGARLVATAPLHQVLQPSAAFHPPRGPHPSQSL